MGESRRAEGLAGWTSLESYGVNRKAGRGEMRVLALLRAVDPAETDAFSFAIVQNFEGVAVEDGDDSAGEVGGQCGPDEKDEAGKGHV